MAIDDKDIAKLKTIFATKDDLKRFATKDDLKRFATKDDLKRFATKDDLKNFATKADVKKIVDEGVDQLARIINDSIVVQLNNHEKRITRLENRGILPPLA